MKLDVASSDGFVVGAQVRLFSPGGGGGELCTVAGFGSLLLSEPLTMAHGAGSIVKQLNEEKVYFMHLGDDCAHPMGRRADAMLIWEFLVECHPRVHHKSLWHVHHIYMQVRYACVRMGTPCTE